MIRLAHLAPEVLEALVISRKSSAVSIYDLATVAERPWAEQNGPAFTSS